MRDESPGRDLLDRVLLVGSDHWTVVADCRIGRIQGALCTGRLEQCLCLVGHTRAIQRLAHTGQCNLVTDIACGRASHLGDGSHCRQTGDIPVCCTLRAFGDLHVVLGRDSP
ncbi:hypothetical protein, partial [Thiolapillus sp.]|uniref:hypothetical protein n=1 Tax=Thiolapillus sp. TaxID=2017437 RepID=UPI003AF797DB